MAVKVLIAEIDGEELEYPQEYSLSYPDLGEADYIDFNTEAVVTPQEGRLYWDSDNNTLSIGMSGGNVSVQIGQEQVIRAKNASGADITNGQAVYVNGGDGSNPTVDIVNNLDVDAGRTLAIATENVTSNQFGYFTTTGLVRDVDTSSWVAGTPLFLDSTDGALTSTQPEAPSECVCIGVVIRQHATEGVIYVKIQPNRWFKPIHDYGSITGWPDNNYSSLTWNDGTRTITITNDATKNYFRYYNRGCEQRVTGTVSEVLPNTTGGYFFYYDLDNTIQLSTSAWDFSEVPISYIYWNATLGEGLALNERHTSKRNIEWHRGQHFNIGTYYLSGYGITGYTLNTATDAAISYAIASGIILDEDIVYNGAGVSDGVQYYMMSRTGASGDWTWTKPSVPILASTGRIYFNEYTGGAWQLSEVDNGDFVNYYVIATTALNSAYNIVVFAGQNSFNSLSEAQDVSLSSDISFGSIPFTEFSTLYRITYETNNSYTNTGKCRIATIADLRGSTTRSQVVGTIPVNNHSSLSGLMSDDHLQYLPVNGDRDMDAGYTPANDLSVATKEYVDNSVVHTLQYQALGQFSYSFYLFYEAHKNPNDDRESGAGDGYLYQNSAPAICGIDGVVNMATLVVRGVAISDATPSSIVTMHFELWNVGFSTEGTKIGDISFDIDSSVFTIGPYYNSSVSSNIKIHEHQTPLSVSQGDMLGLKFISTTGASNIVSFVNATVLLYGVGAI